MSKAKIISTANAPAAVGPYSQAVVVNDIVYTAGQIAIDPKVGKLIEGNITEQAEQVMKNITAVLEAAGTSLDNVVKTTCFVAEMADFAEFNAVYGKYFRNNKPARSCVAVKELPLGALCEVEAIAYL